MTQREDALKFEQGRIKALQEERLHIQKKTFTKWMNSFLQKARMEVEDLFVDLADGRRLLKLLEIISGERLPRPNSGRMRVHKIENVNKSLSFLHTKVRLESIGAEDIVDGNPRLILGLIWTIILRFQIQEIEIDVDEQNESSEKKSAKDALLLWCQRKTSGYHGVHIHNFSDSWRSGLGFNALIHAHRPDLFRWNDLPVTEPVETLNHAFDVAHKHLGIPKLLDAEDVDTTRPDEKSVMTYVASYYHTFARMKNEQKSGRRIANIVGQLVDCDKRKDEYARLITDLLEWIRLKIEELNDRQMPNSLDGIQTLLLAFKEYRTVEKPPKYKERSEIEALLFSISTMQKSARGSSWTPAEGQTPHDLQRGWQRLEQAEHAREIALRTELLRQQRLEQLNYKFNTKSVLRKGYLKEMIQVLSDPRYGSNLAQVDATVKKHEAISADILARTERFEDLSAMAAELLRENYHGAEEVSKTEKAVLQQWRELLDLLERHRQSLATLARLMALMREAETVADTVDGMKSQFQSEEVGRHLSDVERLLQAHALQELQCGALDDVMRRLVRQGNTAEGPAQPKKQLTDQLKNLEDEYDSLVAAAKDRKARLENARNLYQFLEDHDEEESWVTEKQRICRAEVAAKDLRGVLALKQKHAALVHELKAREHVTSRHLAKGQSLIESGVGGSGEISRRLESLQQQWATLRELAEQREKTLAAACDAYQFYGDANEAESWMNERRPLLASTDCGDHAPAAMALLARHKALHEETVAYSAELQTLKGHADALIANGILQLQLPTEVESGAATEQDEWVNETRLVPTEVWQEEPVERLEHRTVTEERKVPQVKALYPFTGQGISIAKGEVMFLISKSNRDWWSVRKADRTDGFVPANYVREIEPRTVPVQVRRPEKVRTVQRVKKTVLVKQVVPTRRAAPAPRRSRPTPALARPPVPEKMDELLTSYDELLKLSAARRAQLEEAIKLFSLFAECDDLEKWIKEKERMLNTEEPGDTVDTHKRKYEKFVTDLSAASKRLEHIEAGVDNLIKGGHSEAQKAAARRDHLRQMWAKLWQLKAERELSLHTASSVEVFRRSCAEALDWMSEKQQQLQQHHPGNMPSSDLRTVQALQRRHAQLERELEPLREKVRTVNLLADSVKSQYPNEKANVEARQSEISEMWKKCEEEAAERRRRLESAVGHQVFTHGSTTLADWLQKTRGQIAQEVHAKDVATAEELYKQHQDLEDDMKAHNDEFKEVIGLGKQLLATNPSLKDVADKIKALDDGKKAMEKEWLEKERYLKQCVELASFYREADQIDARSGAHEAYLDCTDTGASVDEALALMKRHEELESRLAAQDERVATFNDMLNKPHYAADKIAARKKQVLSRRDSVRQRASERRRALQASLAHLQFLETLAGVEAWIGDKLRAANEPSYRDLANLERKLQKHEAFEREFQANEKQLRNVESVGESLIKSDPSRAEFTRRCLERARREWLAAAAAARDKGAKLRQARAQRAHRRDIEDAKARLAELERQIASEEVGADLRSCRRLITQHQALEQELAACAQKAESLSAAGLELVSLGHFDADSIQAAGEALTKAVEALREPAARRRKALEVSMQYHKFASEVSGEMSWLSEHCATVDTTPADLHSAQTAVKKHAKLKAEVTGRGPVIEKVVSKGRELAKDHPKKEQIMSLTSALEARFDEVRSQTEAAGGALEAVLRARHVLHDATEVESWLAERELALSEPARAPDRHSATRLLARHKATELELDTYDSIISEMIHSATAIEASEHCSVPLVKRCEGLKDTLSRLRRKANQRQRALLHSLARHEYLAESAELEEWIHEQFVAASSEDYGQDYEHLLILQSKFEELRHRVESGAERFNQCEELAKKLLASDSPYIPDIENRQEALGAAWQRLVEQIQSRGGKLRAAGDIHRFHRDVAEFISRAAEKEAQLSTEGEIPASVLRARDNLDSELLAIDAQLQVLVEEGERLQSLYPGDNSSQIELELSALQAARDSLRDATAARSERLHNARVAHKVLTEIRDLISWSSSLRASMRPATWRGEARAAQSQAQALRAEHDALRAELEARAPAFRAAFDAATDLVRNSHPKAQEIEEKCIALVEERNRLHNTWASRQVALDQLIDLQCFLRDATQLHDLCVTQKAALSTEISPTASVEEVDNQLKKHEAFEKLLVTQDEKLSTLSSHADKLLKQEHVESPRIAKELATVTQKRKEIHELSALRRDKLNTALTRAQFARDVSEAKIWIADKMKNLQADQKQGEVSNLEDKIKKLQKHQAFRAELAANEARVKEIEALAKQLDDKDVYSTLIQLKEDWAKLLEATEQRGRGLEEAQDILEFNQHLDKIEAWIRDKDMMVQAHDLGRDYEHCSALLRKLDDVDSDMQVDDKHVKSVTALAEKLLRQGPTQQAESVSSRRDSVLGKWRALTGALQAYRDSLTTALEMHAFNRDVQDTQDRIKSKAALFSSKQRGRDLSHAHELKRRHEALSSEASAVGDKINELATRGRNAQAQHPERAKEIESSLEQLRENWNELKRLAEERSAFLEDALAEHKFDESLKELELWVSESVKRMRASTAPEHDANLESDLQAHQEIKAEIDGRQKSIASLKKQAETQLADSPDLPEKLAKLAQLSRTLDDAWAERKMYLTQAHQLQQLKDQAQAVEDWVVAREAVLHNDDLGENLDAVEALIRKHTEFAKLLESQFGRITELKTFADTLLEQGHSASDYIKKRMGDIQGRAEKLKESCVHRGQMLQQSLQFHHFLRDLNHETEWIALKIQTATDQNYRELSNLQSKIQKHTAFESELAANKGRIDDVANRGEELIEAKHYASREISQHVEELENQWRHLQEAVKLRRDRLQEAYQARVYLRGLDDFISWLDDVESQLLSEDHGKDLSSVSALLKRHTRLEQTAASKAETVSNLLENARELSESKHFMAEEIVTRASEAAARYRQLQEPMQSRRENLEDAALLHRWNRDADDEMRWLEEREALVVPFDTRCSLAQAQAAQKKYLALEAEINARSSSTSSLTCGARSLCAGGHYAGGVLERRAAALEAAQRRVQARARDNCRAATRHVERALLLADLSEAHAYLMERLPLLTTTDYGRDEDSVISLQKSLDVKQRELRTFDDTIDKLEKSATNLLGVDRTEPEDEQITAKLNEIKQLYEEMKLLSAKRERRLEQSLKYFKFVLEVEETAEHLSAQMSTAASEEYGVDAEHVDTLRQQFDAFHVQINANEGRIESVCEAGQALIEENSPESERVKQKMEDIRGLWEDLKELAAARQEALDGARQVHEFDRAADETVSWIAEKDLLLGEGHSHTELHVRRRRLEALKADLDAIKAAHRDLSEQAEKLGTAFPDAREHVACKLEDVSDSLDALVERSTRAGVELELAEHMQAYFATYQDLMAWCNETLARVTAPELAKDVIGAERLAARHKDIHTEIMAKDEEFQQLYNDGDKLLREGHFMSSEISDKMAALRARRQLLDETWSKRNDIYAQHLDALIFIRDADALDGWIAKRVPLVRDGKLGDSVSQVEELINRHRDLEETIDAQKERFLTLKRITLIEQAFKAQKEEEANARRISAEKKEAERMEQYRQQEMKRIADERRRQAPQREDSITSTHSTVPDEILSPAPQFDKLPKADSAVKRAESMQVVKTPKRTPSFTTRRRTQSFRRQRPDIAPLPPVEIEGYLERKQEAGVGGKRATVRSWRALYSVLCGQLLCFFRDEADFAGARAQAPPLAIRHARCEPADDYTKRSHVFRLFCADGAEYLFACSSRASMEEWVAKISFHADLPPQLQLTPYDRDQVVGNSSSPSPTSSPEQRRSQADILNDAKKSDRVIESAVLPSLPPRQLDNESRDEVADVVLRSQDQPGWGRTRFSNGRDMNAEFIRSQQEASGLPPLPSSGPPTLPERGPNLPERVPNLPERNANIAERPPSIPERSSGEQKSVTALVNSYQQRMSNSNTNAPNWANDGRNNNWQNVETTSHFYSTNEFAYGGGSSGGGPRPASVAGSGGSPALDQRPASRSSGESELSLSGMPKDKKDKKGVFGGLFSRKKRPQSHM